MDQPDEVVIPDPGGGGGGLVVLRPGQRYAVTFTGLTGIITCLRCGALVDDQLIGAHDASHEEV